MGRWLASTRARVLLGALVLLAGTIVVTVVADRALLLGRLSERIDDELAQEVDEFQRLSRGSDPATGEPFGTDLAAIFDTFFARNVPGDGEVMLGILGTEPYLRSADAPHPIDEEADLLRRWVRAAEPAYGTDSTPAGEVRWLVVPVAGPDGERLGSFVAAAFPEGERARVDEAVRTAAAVGLVAFALASIVAWVIAGRVLAPLGHLATATESVQEDRLEVRVPVEGTGELAELSRTFNDMLDRVEGAFATQRAFLDDAGHELRTPITVIRGHLELAEPDEPLGDSTREIVFDELDRMARIVEDLILIAKAERPDFVVPAPVDVDDLTREVLDKARPLAERDWVLRADAVLVADLDRERITQAWMNLLRNAVQHTTTLERIAAFATAVDGGRALELGVEDHGEGVAPEDRERIFERFGRGTSVRRTRSDGAGLGLSIARAVAVAHGGDLELRDTPGGGATFVLRLPLAVDDHPAADPLDEEETPWPAS